MKTGAYIALTILAASMIYFAGVVLSMFTTSAEFKISGATSAASVLFLSVGVLTKRNRKLMFGLSLAASISASLILLRHFGKPEGYVASWDIAAVPNWCFSVFFWATMLSPVLVTVSYARRKVEPGATAQRDDSAAF